MSHLFVLEWMTTHIKIRGRNKNFATSPLVLCSVPLFPYIHYKLIERKSGGQQHFFMILFMPERSERNGKKMNKRNNYIDICKGIGIISVVVGHAANTDYFYSAGVNDIRKFVYIYHLVIFFWCSGYLYKQKDIRAFANKIIKQYYFKNALICLMSLVLLPLWNKLRVYDVIGMKDLLMRILRIFAFKTGGIYVGAVWFVQFLCITYVIFYITRTFLKQQAWVADVALGILGIILVLNKKLGIYYVNLALLMQPVFGFGYYCKNKPKVFLRFKDINFLPIMVLLIVIMNKMTGQEIEFSKSQIYGGWLFYPMVLIGLLFVFSLASLVEKLNGKIIQIIGKHSLFIMSTHFIVFKLFDGIVGNYIKETTNSLTLFPIVFPEYRILYALIGIFVPLGVIILWKWICSKIMLCVKK